MRRDPGLVADGLVLADAARRDYGVVLTDTGDISLASSRFIGRGYAAPTWRRLITNGGCQFRNARQMNVRDFWRYRKVILAAMVVINSSKMSVLWGKGRIPIWSEETINSRIH